MQNPTIKYFAYEHLPQHLQIVSKPIGDLAALMDITLIDGAEKQAGLRKLLEAKDCFVRSALDGVNHPPSDAPNVKLATVEVKVDASEAIAQVEDAKTGLQLLAKVRAFIEKHGLGCPESLYQRDNPQIDALSVMGDLCELAGWQQDEEGDE